MRVLLRPPTAICALLLLAFCCVGYPAAAQDSDHDGLTDTFEAALVQQFIPRVMLSRPDCSGKPALFASEEALPTPRRDDGTVYAQAFPRSLNGKQRSSTEIELHFYFLWRVDCGRMGHPLDAEHVSALLHGSGNNPADWHAVYWYAAAHEDTVCDASQVTRASTLQAETHGATVWISQGKHASFLAEELCRNGCGGDRCVNLGSMTVPSVINLGELSAPMNGATWVSSANWPLAEKMRRSDFTTARIDRLQQLPVTDIAWANPALRPEQAAISGANAAIDGTLIGGNATSDALALGNRHTNTALVLATAHTDNAISAAEQSTGNSLAKSYRNVIKAIGSAAKQTRESLGP